MRAALETIALTEKYLLHELSDIEIQAFNFRMATEPDFKESVEIQQQLMNSLERISLQQTIQSAQRTYRLWRLLKGIGLIVISIVLAFLIWYFVNASAETTRETESIPTKVETLEATEKSDTDITTNVTKDTVKVTEFKKTSTVTTKESVVFNETTETTRIDKIPSEIFSISVLKDTIVETKSGMIVMIPKNSFVDSDQNRISENVQLEIKEATDSHTIMTAGLSTHFENKPLETGGMFFIEATKDGKKLQIHPEKEIIVDVPTLQLKTGMQLFDGEVLENGTVAWKNPKLLQQQLFTKDILSLDFYPPNYLDSLAKKGYDSSNKQFTDSLYYSFGTTSNKVVYNRTIGEYLDEEFRIQNLRQLDTVQRDLILVPSKDSIKSETAEEKRIAGLDPLKVKTIWNERFQQTFIATEAFEERLRFIHENCRNANYMLDVYLQNLDKNLHVSDSIIAYSIGGDAIDSDFLAFSKQRLTNVTNVSEEISKLNQYYVLQQKVYRLAVQKAQKTVDSIINIDKKYQAFSKRQLQDLYSNELAVTTQKVAKELNVRLPNVVNRSQQSNTVSTASIIQKEQQKRRYRASIRTTGWKNIDRIINEKVISSVQNRTTTTIENKEKRVTITYSDYEVRIQNEEKFDQLFVYVVPKEFNSFIRLTPKNNRFTYRLNDLLMYKVYCIGYVNEIPFYVEKSILNTSDNVRLRKTTTASLQKKLANLNTENSNLETEVLYHLYKQQNVRKLRKYRELVSLKKDLYSVVFPCQKSADVGNVISTQIFTDAVAVQDAFIETTTVSFELVEIVPVFPGCETFTMKEERKQCFTDSLLSFVNKEIDLEIITKNQPVGSKQVVYVDFEIDSLGVIKNIKVRTNNPKIEAEVIRVMQLLPTMTPGMENGNYVSVTYTIPLYFNIN